VTLKYSVFSILKDLKRIGFFCKTENTQHTFLITTVHTDYCV
jgi:hypothetical protein